MFKLSDIFLLSLLSRFPGAATDALIAFSNEALRLVEQSFNFEGWASSFAHTTIRSLAPIDFLSLILNDFESVHGKHIMIGGLVIILKSRLGQGSQGSTFIGEARNKKVVVKIFNPFSTISNPREAFQNEVTVLRRLDRYITSDESLLVVVQEYIKGPVLHSVLESLNPTIPDQRKLMTKLSLQYLEAVVSFAFDTGYAHNDASPLNAIVTEDGIKLIDFGLAIVAPEAEMGSTSDFDYAFKELTMDFPTIKSQLLDS
jgi:predicted Ser/Thr protein kinase